MYVPVTDTIEIDRDRQLVRTENREVYLTGLEFGMFQYLALHPNRICSREELLDRVWGERFQYDTGTIDVHLNALRHKLGFSKNRPIETIRGAGLVFRVEQPQTRYTIDLQSFAREWLECHAPELQAKGLTPGMHLTPFVNEITIEPKALKKMLDAVLDALLPSAQPGHLRLNSKLTIQYFILSLEINGTTNELKIPIERN